MYTFFYWEGKGMIESNTGQTQDPLQIPHNLQLGRASSKPPSKWLELTWSPSEHVTTSESLVLLQDPLLIEDS